MATDWVRDQLARIEREGRDIDPVYLREVCRRFRDQVGDSYELIAVVIERQHAALLDATRPPSR